MVHDVSNYITSKSFIFLFLHFWIEFRNDFIKCFFFPFVLMAFVAFLDDPIMYSRHHWGCCKRGKSSIATRNKCWIDILFIIITSISLIERELKCSLPASIAGTSGVVFNLLFFSFKCMVYIVYYNVTCVWLFDNYSNIMVE